MTIRSGSILLLFSLIIFPKTQIFAQPAPASRSDASGIITGKILVKSGGPLAGGSVFFYEALTGTPPFKDQVRRLHTLRVDIDADGKFRAELPPGKYYMKAVKRLFTEKAGALQDGDYVYYSVDSNGEAKEYVVKSGEILDIGTISDAVPYKKSEDVIKTAIEGVITDREGKPVEGVTVFALTDYTIITKPLYFSTKTGTDGKYVLRVPEGTYYLRARNKLKGGPPEPGHLLGMFGGKTPVPVTVKDAEIKKGIDITVIRFPGKGPRAGAGPRTGSQ